MNLSLLKLKTASLLLFSLLISLLASACYYDQSPRAVERARKYALNNLRELTEVQRSYIRFTDPVIYENVIYPNYAFSPADFYHVQMDEPRSLPRRAALDYMHSCVVWSPPDLGAKVVVVGEGERSMRFWSPNRVLIKNYIPWNLEEEQAFAIGVNYVMNTMLFLSDSARNRVRFSEPEIVLTKFDLSDDDLESGDIGKSPWESYVASIANEKEPVQVSLVWKGDEEGERIVVTGYVSSAKSMADWSAENGRLITKEALDSNTLTKDEIKALAE